MDQRGVYRLFYDDEPVSFETVNTSHGDADFREVIIAKLVSGEKRVIKLAENDFTFPDKMKMWERTVAEYQKLGYYCPAIFRDRTGSFPLVSYRGRNCVAFAEEFAPYLPAQQRDQEEDVSADEYWEDIWIMTAKIAAKHLDYAAYPSGYCLFETFCPSDATDEVLENALSWKEYADTLPVEVQKQVQRIWQLWIENRKKLEAVYPALPTSVFQADLNPTNILLDENGKFAGIYDFNLCGKDVFLNYLFREAFNTDFAQEIERIAKTLRIASRYYSFSEIEKDSALMLYRCLKPLWFNKLQKLKGLKDDVTAIQAYLTETERYLTERIDFSQWME